MTAKGQTSNACGHPRMQVGPLPAWGAENLDQRVTDRTHVRDVALVGDIDRFQTRRDFRDHVGHIPVLPYDRGGRGSVAVREVLRALGECARHEDDGVDAERSATDGYGVLQAPTAATALSMRSRSAAACSMVLR